LGKKDKSARKRRR
jgi:hypothetical protein